MGQRRAGRRSPPVAEVEVEVEVTTDIWTSERRLASVPTAIAYFPYTESMSAFR